MKIPIVTGMSFFAIRFSSTCGNPKRARRVDRARAVLEDEDVGRRGRVVLRRHVDPVAPHRIRDDLALERERAFQPALRDARLRQRVRPSGYSPGCRPAGAAPAAGRPRTPPARESAKRRNQEQHQPRGASRECRHGRVF